MSSPHAYIVEVCVRCHGRKRWDEFKTFKTREAADRTVWRLIRVGCPARVQTILTPTGPEIASADQLRLPGVEGDAP